MPVRSVCIYCGSSNRVDEKYKNLARDVGQALAQQGIRVIYGGGHVGLMGVLADSCLAAGGQVTGIIPEHIRAQEVQHTSLTELLVVDSMHTRKSFMAEKAEAFVALPGGFGTLDEVFEILTWKQLGLHNKPILFFNKDGFWNPALSLIEHLITAHFAPESNRQLFQSVTDIPAMLESLNQPPPPYQDIKAKWK